MINSSQPLIAEGWDPHTYRAFTAEFRHYDNLHTAVVDATRDLEVATVLDLGIGTGEAARRLLSEHKNATVIGIDANQAMLDVAKLSLPPERTTLICRRMEDPLPPGPFDLVVSVLAVHHLDGPAKSELFARISDVLAPNGRFVLGDIVLLESQMSTHRASLVGRLRESLRRRGVAGTVRSIDWHLRRVWSRRGPTEGEIHHDRPDLLVDQLAWMTEAGLRSERVQVPWDKDRLVVIVAYKTHP